MPKHAAPTRSLQLQERDAQLCATLALVGVATVAELEWLHVPSFRSRDRQHRARQHEGDTRPYYPSTSLYRRLHLLTDHGYLSRVLRTVRHGSTSFGRVADAYRLARAGAQLATRYLERDELVPYIRPSDETALLTLEHTLLIARCYAALTTAMHWTGGATIAGWRGDRELRAFYDQVQVWHGQRWVAEGLQPDAAFVLRTDDTTKQCFLEVDSGLQSVARWQAKVRRYERYHGSTALAERYGVPTFQVLVVAPSWQHAARLATATVAETSLPAAYRRYWFLAEELVRPSGVRPNWKRVAEVSWHREQRRDQLVSTPTATLGETESLWTVRPRT